MKFSIDKQIGRGAVNEEAYITLFMEQMQVSEDKKVPVNYEAKELSRETRELRPVVFREGDAYCCLLGPDPQSGIFGCGKTPKKSITDWERHLQQRMDDPTNEDDVTRYVHDVLNDSGK